jgi:hypothetical protein
MRDYSFALAVLGILLVAGCVACKTSATMLSNARLRQQTAEAALAENQGTLATMTARKYNILAGMPAIDSFLREWTPLMSEGAMPGQIGLELTDLSRRLGLAGTRRPTPLRTDYPLGDSIKTLQMVGFSVTGDYRTTMSWLGNVEDRFPAARIESLTLSGSGSAANEVELTLTLGFWLNDPDTKKQ